MTGGMAFVYDISKNFIKKVNPESVVWQQVETGFWIDNLKNLIIDHAKNTDSKLSNKILKDFDNQLKNFIQVCPKEMLDKLDNPITFKKTIKEVS